MEAITYKKACSNLGNIMKQVCNDHLPVIITRQNSNPVVLISLDDYNAMEETAYLLRNPQNAKRLMESIDELESGKGLERDLIK